MNESGLGRVDSDVNHEISDMAKAFGITPEFAFYNDFDGANAKAFRDHGEYHVIVGIRLLHKITGSLNPLDGSQIPQQFPEIWGGATAGVIAHEWAHLVQFKQNVRTNASTVAPLELHADFMAGWYMGTKGTRMKVAYEELQKAFFSMGDRQFNNPSHHGTPQQRLDALKSGYALGASSQRSMEDVFNEGVRKYDLVRK